MKINMNQFLLGAALAIGASYLFKTVKTASMAYSYPGYDLSDTSWMQGAQSYRPGRQSLTPPVLTRGGSHASMCEASIDRYIAKVNGMPLPAGIKSTMLTQLETQRARCTPRAWTPHGTRVSG